ncbi:hypothetical protein BC936DRAFT_140255 [Jimgerdemannia flammicorona]|uniref:Cyclin-like domain-containing protein n=1 Tax=Jimgerdemannia flammicorona TaxID=994334 RepID=A0A433DH06_9FUNG|nr:hypothetical protein BC936DRAFT_140255 [Jimgerdemannia flammicorona]
MDLYCDEMDLDPPLHHQDNRRFPLKNLSNAHRGHQHSKTNRKYTPYSTHTRADLQTSRYSDLCHHVSVEKQQGSSATIDNDFAGLARSSHVAETHSRRPRLVRPFEYNPWYWNEYAPDVYSHFRDLEKSHRPRTSYMSKQTEINSNMRAILIDWLVEVVLDLRLSEETLYMTVNYIDRFLSYVRITRSNLQCVGIAALFVASKYEEVEPPFLSELADITDRTYTERQILAMEQKILKVLRFELTVVSVRSFAIYFVHASECDERMAAFVNVRWAGVNVQSYAGLLLLGFGLVLHEIFGLIMSVFIACCGFLCAVFVRFDPLGLCISEVPAFGNCCFGIISSLFSASAVEPPVRQADPPSRITFSTGRRYCVTYISLYILDRSPRLANGLPARTPFQLCPEPVRPARQVLRVRARVRGRQGHALVARGETRVWVGCRQDAT